VKIIVLHVASEQHTEKLAKGVFLKTKRQLGLVQKLAKITEHPPFFPGFDGASSSL